MHSARRIVAIEGAEDPASRVATLELACGCVVTRTIAADRILTIGDEQRAVGKYPCPVGHPVRPPLRHGEG